VKELQLPEELKGAWEHALVLTYGADLPFFERSLARQLPVSCRNRLILADGKQHLEACIRYAQGRLVRTLNQHYVADGLRVRHAMHAKLILLTGQTRGRLLVGSGNLGMQGYASGGEIFTRYEYEPEGEDDLAAFISIRSFLEQLLERAPVGEIAAARLGHMFENSPWLFQQASDPDSPVRHNLDQSFLAQLLLEVAGEPVEQLTLAAPFYDAKATAFGTLLQELAPKRTRVLVQPNRTSVDPRVLDRLAADHPGTVEIIPVGRDGDATYLHAKLILLKLAKRAICLQGSPNLSQVALLRAGENANVELANLIRGGRGDFDHLFADLDFGQANSAKELALAYEPQDTVLPPALAGWHLLRGQWRNDELTLDLSREPPELRDASLVVGDRAHTLNVLSSSPRQLTLKLEKEAQDLLERTLPVAIEWTSAAGKERTNPVFAYNLLALERTLEAAIESERLSFVGSLDGLDDEELERLLQELADSLVIDPEGLWKLAGREPSTDTHEEELWLAYEDVDYEALRQHPKLSQYAAGFRSVGGQRSRLQMILASIAASFGPERSIVSAPAVNTITALDESEADTEEELERRAEEREQRRAMLEAHLRRIFQNFIRRYLRGATSVQFEQRVGPEVIAQNYLVFSFILWRLFRKSWMPTDFLIESLLQTWSHFWGGGGNHAFIERLDEERRKQTLAWLGEHQANGLFLAGLYYAAYLTRIEEDEQVRIDLRDRWRRIVCKPPFALNTSVVAEAVQILAGLIPTQPPSAHQLALELSELADYETRSSFVSSLGGPGAAWFEEVNVMRPALKRQISVPCLVLGGTARKGAILDALGRWMRFEQREFYRVRVDSSETVCFYDTLTGQGVYWEGRRTKPYDFEDRPIINASWDQHLDSLFGRDHKTYGGQLTNLLGSKPDSVAAG
jgi:hypothetical protein